MRSNFVQIFSVIVASLAISVSGSLRPADALGDFPEATLKTPVLVPEESVSTYVPSQAAPGAGIAVNMIFPEKPRYGDGAPIAVIAPGGMGADGLTFTMHSAQAGFVEVRLAFPGGGKSKFQSGGIYDYRGSESQVALKDVILFASGKIPDTKGRFINELLPVKVAKTNVGVVGWSNGGNVLMATLGKFPEELRTVVNWAVFYESPIGPLFFPPNLGGMKDLLSNKHYREGSAATGGCIVDWKNLRWDSSILRNPGEHKKLGEPEIPGVLYFDENRNGVWDESAEFALTYTTDVGLDKQIYPPEVLSALQREKLFDKWVPDEPEDEEDGEHSHDRSSRSFKPKAPPKPVPKAAAAPPAKSGKQSGQGGATNGAAGGPTGGPGGPLAPGATPGAGPGGQASAQKVKHVIAWPKALATLRESEAFYQDRDGSEYFGRIAKEYPWLMVIVVGTYMDHLQRQPDHPHIAMQYNAWLAHKVKWIRLNPESCYLALITGMNHENFTNNKPNASIDASTIGNYLEGEGTTKDYVMVYAACAELADRRRAKNLAFPLPLPLTMYFNSANPPPLPPVKKEQ